MVPRPGDIWSRRCSAPAIGRAVHEGTGQGPPFRRSQSPRPAAVNPDLSRLAASGAWYNGSMDVAAVEKPTRRPRFRRASEPPAFRLTDGDVEIVRQLARFRFLRSTHIAALVS